MSSVRERSVLIPFLVSGKCLFLSGFTEEQLNHMHDTTLPGKYRMGFTNMVARATPGSKDLSRWVTQSIQFELNCCINKFMAA